MIKTNLIKRKWILFYNQYEDCFDVDNNDLKESLDCKIIAYGDTVEEVSEIADRIKKYYGLTKKRDEALINFYEEKGDQY